MKNQLKKVTMATLNGTSLAVVIALIPSALLSQLLKFLPANSVTNETTVMITMVQSALPLIAAFAVGSMLKYGLLESGSMSLAAMVAGGIITQKNGSFIIGGSGVILNILLTVWFAAWCVLLCQKFLGQFKTILEPLLVLLIAGGLGLATMPLMVAVQNFIGQIVKQSTNASPIIMGIILGMIFAVLIVSPISSVGIAMAISLAGIGSGAANAGITACSFTLAWMGASVNPLGTTLAHFLGSPKIQMANMIKQPKLFVPVLLASGVSGAVTTILNLKGTPFSAGFGFSGLIGPLTAYQTSSGSLLLVRVLVGFVIVPVIMAGLCNWLFVKRSRFVDAEDLQLTIN